MTAQLPENPFPGMNPYLESVSLWPDVHNSIIARLRDSLAPRLWPDYGVRMQQRVYVAEEPSGAEGQRFRIPDAIVLSGGPDALPPELAVDEPSGGKGAVAVQLPASELLTELYLEVLRVDNLEVVAVLELLSPSNKIANRGDYLSKRDEVKNSTAHLVEIDLLRLGQPMPVVGVAPPGCYRILVANSRRRPNADLYTFGIREPLPEFVMPLSKGSPGISVNLTPILADSYALGTYRMFIDYQQDPEPPLSEDDRAWLDRLLRERGLRGNGDAR